MTFNGVNTESCSDPQKPVLEALGQVREGLRVTQGKMLFFHLNHLMIAFLFLKFGNPIKERTGTLLQKVWHVLLLGKGSCWLCLGLVFICGWTGDECDGGLGNLLVVKRTMQLGSS